MTASHSTGELSDRICYTLRFPAPQTHYMEVEAAFPTDGTPAIDLFMAVWTPGSYLVREYQRHVENVVGRDAAGNTLGVHKIAKNRWRVETGGTPVVTVAYRVYGREMSVRTNWIESGFAIINGAPTFLSPVGGARGYQVRIELPAGWSGSATALTPVAGQSNVYVAEDFDTLVDSPILVGNPLLREFHAAGKRHHVVAEGDPSFFDIDRVTNDTQQIVEAAGRVMGGRYDYPHYYFLNVISDGSGGLEHKNSFVLMANRFATRNRRGYFDYLSLVAHEYFHNWNGKRLRPIELGPFDYESEVHSKALWIVEGFTDYYGNLVVRRAGLSSRDEFLGDLSAQIEAVQHTPGRLVTAIDMASYDTWIKQYRPDENTANTTVNYYPKGSVIAFLLDARIRRATGGARSLDDAMRLAYERYSGETGYTLEQFYQTMSEIAGTDLRAWFSATVESPEELDYTETLEWFGLRFRPCDTRHVRAWSGAMTRNDNGRLVVSGVRRDTPAYEGGLNVDDEILAIDDVRVRADGLTGRLEQYKPGDTIAVLVARRDRLTHLNMTLAADPGRAWKLDVSPTATARQREQLASWLGH
jgi:predicted metalloprotease with PDZ domain